MLVEDDEDNREMLQLFLQGRGHEVFAASDGVQGLSVIVQHRPHLALIDLALPSMHGIEVARLVRSSLASVYLVALTGYGRGDDRVDAMGAGFDEYLLKPLQPGELDRIITLAYSSAPRLGLDPLATVLR